MKQFFLTYIAIFISFVSFSTPSLPDTITVSREFTLAEQNLDSLYTLYFPQADTSLLSSVSEAFLLHDSVYRKRFKTLSFPFQVAYNQEVKKFIKLFTEKKRLQTELLLALAERQLPLFEQALQKDNLPLIFKYLPVAESFLNPLQITEEGGAGVWRIMYITAKMYGLEVNTFTDQRRESSKATQVAVRYLSDLYAIYNDWALSLAAYNCGPGNVNKAIIRSGSKRSLAEIYPFLPQETRFYLPLYFASVYVLNYAKEHALKPVHLPDFSCDTVSVNKRLHLGQVSAVMNLSLKELRLLNPTLRKDIFHGKKTATLYLPDSTAAIFSVLKNSIYAYKDSVFFAPKPVYRKPPVFDSSSDEYAFVPVDLKNKTKVQYIVKEGDNVGFIAKWYNVKVSDLRYWNNIRRNLIRVGQKLTIYVPKDKAHRYVSINKMNKEQKNRTAAVSINSNTSSSALKLPMKMPTDGKFVYYRIRKGENLWTIARKFSGISNLDIMKLNKLSDKDVKRLRAGHIIKIKKK